MNFPSKMQIIHLYGKSMTQNLSDDEIIIFRSKMDQLLEKLLKTK